jgi:hypothetical protein
MTPVFLVGVEGGLDAAAPDPPQIVAAGCDREMAERIAAVLHALRDVPTSAIASVGFDRFVTGGHWRQAE